MPKEPGPTAAPLVPEHPTLQTLKRAAADCQACPLWKTGTQTVFAEGQRVARVVLVGEQPGNDEDLAGRPFVGPAGRVLDEALAEAGIDRATTYVTNAVKHFKWEPHGKRRLHKKPNAREIAACRPWLDAELAVLKPEVVVCMGATAAQALLGRGFRVSAQHGQWIDAPLAKHVMATVHPASILRAPDEAARHEARRQFVADLKKVASVLRQRGQLRVVARRAPHVQKGGKALQFERRIRNKAAARRLPHSYERFARSDAPG